MGKDPAFLFYSSDFLTGIMFLDMKERGQYITALCLLHQHGGYLPKEKIEFVIGEMSEKLLTKFQISDNGDLFHKRLIEESEKRSSYTESRRKNAKKQHMPKHMVNHMPKHMENENDNENINLINKNKLLLNNKYKNDKFNLLYNKYPKKVGKKAAWKHYNHSVTCEDDVKNAEKALENYLKSERVFKGFIQNASTWFNNWQDWIEFTEDICQYCKGKGKYTSSTGYEVICKCPAGKGK